MNYDMEPMLDLFIYETEQLVTKLEEFTMDAEESGVFSDDSIQEIFRAMHTIKGSAAMLMYEQIATLSHVLEDLFDLMRNNKVTVDVNIVAEFVFEMVDYVKSAMERIYDGDKEEVSSAPIKEQIIDYIKLVSGEDIIENNETVVAKHYFIPSLSEDESTYEYEIVIVFNDDSTMENIRGYTLMNAVKVFAIDIVSIPGDLLEDDEDIIKVIKEDGFKLLLKSNEEKQVIIDYLTGYPYVASFEVKDKSKKIKLKAEETEEVDIEAEAAEVAEAEIDIESEADIVAVTDSLTIDIFLDDKEENERINHLKEDDIPEKVTAKVIATKVHTKKKDKMISVYIEKLDCLMDLIGELVVSESIVSGNDAVQSIQSELLDKALRMHRKIINEIQDIAMSIRMVPLSGVFQKMKRLVRNLSNKLDKDIELILIGEQTEVDKSINDRISDPLMHLIRNSCDHGIESKKVRTDMGKNQKGRVTLEARNSGGEVFIVIKDDGKGLDPDMLYRKAIENNMLSETDPRPSDATIFTYIFKAGFSTKDEVSEYSGRGVGMDVAVKNIEQLGGSISIKSVLGEGSSFTVKIPLTLSIINGMKLRVGSRYFIIPITGIRQSFKVEKDQYIKEPMGFEMILLRGVAYKLLKLYDQFEIKNCNEDINEGIVVMVGNESDSIALFADELLGEQQVVVKPLPSYLKKIQGISGCAILGDGGISLIIDLEELIKM